MIGPRQAKDIEGTVAYGARQNIAANAPPPPPGFVPEQGQKPPQTFGHYASNAWDVVSPANLAHAARDAVVPRSPDDWISIAGLGPIRQLYEPSVDLTQKGIKSIREGKTLSGIRSLGNAAIPMFGPISEKAGEQLNTGDYAGAAGTMTGGGIAAFAPKAIGKYGPGIVRGIQEAGQGTAIRLQAPAHWKWPNAPLLRAFRSVPGHQRRGVKPS